MVSGDVVNSIQSVSDTNRLTIRPASGDEYVIHNLYMGGSYELYITDGTNEIQVESGSSESLTYFTFHLTNGHYLEIKNVSGGSAVFGYDGVKTKE